MRTLIKLIIAGLIIHGAWRAGAAYYRHYQFRDALQEVAIFSGGKTDQEVHTRAMEVASRFEVPIAPENLMVRRDRGRTFIDASYEGEIEILPTYFYPWEFKTSVQAYEVELVTPDFPPSGR